MAEKFLYEIMDGASQAGFLKKEAPDFLKNNLSRKFELRPYQIEAFSRFIHCLNNDYPGKEHPLHFAFNMATGSGKTLIMAGLILYLYEKGFRNFLFFVNSTNIIGKTRENFLNPKSSKFLFEERIVFDAKRVAVTQVDNFESVNANDISICFTTIQKLHSDLTSEKENAITFEDFKRKKIVLIADEAHHINVNTKSDKELFESWENTVEQIFHQNEENLLLEFTATIDYAHSNISEKYRNKVIYRYDLKEFRGDKYSKDVYIVQSDFEEKERIIQALLLSQYKQEVAAKNRISLKPVILFKAQKTIEQSKQNKENFHKIIEGLSAADIDKIRKMSDMELIMKAFKFFEENKINSEMLAGRLKSEFNEKRCISVNEEKEKEVQQILLNSLEDKDNPVRAIFAVQKLNEGWDVLNLFDIVRCYSSRDAKAGAPGKTTISEAQLIGRGARYYPFAASEYPDRFRRKFDSNLENELRILEELHYHSINDSRYISELRTALIEEGLIDEQEVEKKLTLKKSFSASEFYNNGLIYINERIKNKNENIKSFDDLGVKRKNYQHTIASGKGISGAIFDEDSKAFKIKEANRKDVSIKDISYHILQNALARNIFFSFGSLKHYFPHLRTTKEFITSQYYLSGLQVTFQGDLSLYGDKVPLQHCLDGVEGLLKEIESEIKRNTVEFKGSTEFKPFKISDRFTDKLLKLNKRDARADGDEEYVSDKDWYVFNTNYGTSEEKAFVRMLDRQMSKLREKYDGIYLVRNERHFKIYSFSEGEAFEPDFVLFLKEKSGSLLTYQLFIEPKGKHLKENDRWKERFLKEITDKFKDKILVISEKSKYRLLGIPFYNNDDENKFKESLYALV